MAILSRLWIRLRSTSCAFSFSLDQKLPEGVRVVASLEYRSLSRNKGCLSKPQPDTGIVTMSIHSPLAKESHRANPDIRGQGKMLLPPVGSTTESPGKGCGYVGGDHEEPRMNEPATTPPRSGRHPEPHTVINGVPNRSISQGRSLRNAFDVPSS